MDGRPPEVNHGPQTGVIQAEVMRFFAGFMSASLLWAGAFFAYTQGWLGGAQEPEEVSGPVAEVAAAPQDEPGSKGRKRRKPRRGPDGQLLRGSEQGTGTIGDDIGWDDEQALDMAGGEQQLTGSQIEAGFDSVMQRIRRCLVLVPADGEVTGQLTFGMRVGSDGKAKAVNLSGPSIVTGGESGSCLRSAAQGIQFAKWNGPDAVFKYPVTLH